MHPFDSMQVQHKIPFPDCVHCQPDNKEVTERFLFQSAQYLGLIDWDVEHYPSNTSD
jgi:hypothetical protein